MKLVKYPDPILIQECQGRMSKNLYNKLANDMIDFLKGCPGGIGLAAPQIGSDVRLFVMKVGESDAQLGYEVCYQPMVLFSGKDQDEFGEECLSLPNEKVIVKRPMKIVVEYTNRFGNRVEAWLTGMQARCFQHELDHLNGILITNYRKTV